MQETLKELHARGHHLFLATSKPEPFAEKIIARFGLAPYFSFIGGSTFDETRTAKDAVIAYVLETQKIAPDSAIMVGDRSYDIEGAHKNNLPSIGVLYGYGSAEELQGADYRIDTFAGLLTL